MGMGVGMGALGLQSVQNVSLPTTQQQGLVPVPSQASDPTPVPDRSSFDPNSRPMEPTAKQLEVASIHSSDQLMFPGNASLA